MTVAPPLLVARTPPRAAKCAYTTNQMSKNFATLSRKRPAGVILFSFVSINRGRDWFLIYRLSAPFAPPCGRLRPQAYQSQGGVGERLFLLFAYIVGVECVVVDVLMWLRFRGLSPPFPRFMLILCNRLLFRYSCISA